MRKLSFHRTSLAAALLLIIALLLGSLHPSGTLAQEPPTETLSPTQEPPPAEPTSDQVFEIVPAQEPDSTALPAEQEPTVEAEPTPTPEPEAVPEVMIPNQVQGVVKLDATIAPGSLKSGDTITYTYIMTNTTGAAVNPKLRLRWVDFSETDRGGIVQFCAAASCPSESAQGGISVGSAEKLTINSQPVFQYTVSNLAAGQSARFSIRLRTRTDRYPQTGKEPTRPAGSAQLFLNDNFSSPISEDTANTQIVGPVFVPSKAVTNTAAKVYPLETVEFTISVGNATGTGDVINGRTRADALDATTVKLVDSIPLGSEFVSAEGNPAIDTQRKTLTWDIPSLLKGQTVTFKVRFKKTNTAQDCGRLSNTLYYVTSPQMPIRIGSTPYQIDGRGVSANVITPLEIQSISADPAGPIYGTESRLTIKVRNFFNQPITGLKLIYFIQSNAFYLPNTATPTPGVTPGSGTGGQIEWTFNMPAGGVDTPVTSEFTLRIRGAYTSLVANGSGLAQLVIPDSIPSSCTRTLTGRANLQPRIILSKFTDVQPISGKYYAEQGEEFPYTLEIKNQGVEDANGMTVYDAFPFKGGSNFSYVQGSAKLNGAAFRDPDVLQNGVGGRVQWEGLNIPLGNSIQISYQLRIEGNEFDEYCTVAGGVLNEETITVRSNQLCVKINPDFLVEKSANVATLSNQPQGEVKFTLKLTNQSGKSYQVGLYDELGSFSFTSQESGYASPSLGNPNNLEWPLTTLAPGQNIQAVIRTKIPNECITKDYINEARFLFVANDGSKYVVQSIPRTEVKVRHNCGTNKLEYTAAVDRPIISLQDQVKYTITIKNLNTTGELTNIDVFNILPEGFKFVSLSTEGQVRTAPTQTTRADGRVKLSWRIPTLASNASTKIVFNGRSGDIVGDFDNWVRATATNLLEATCRGICTLPITDEGETVIYSRGITAVKPLHTALPEITSADSCATPDDERTYSLSLINTNSHPYASTAVTLTLPLGLHLEDSLSLSPTKVIYETDGRTTVVWNNIIVPAKPANSSSALVKIQLQLRIGRVWDDLTAQAQISSPDGSIPRQDSVDDPTVKMCIDGAAIAKDASKLLIDPSNEFIYQISVVNPESSPLTLTVGDLLPSQLTYVAQVSGPTPTRTGSQLTWSNLSVPATNNGKPGIATIKFRVKLTGGGAGDTVRNTATVSASSGQVKSEYGSVDVKVRQRSNLYLPLVKK